MKPGFRRAGKYSTKNDRFRPVSVRAIWLRSYVDGRKLEVLAEIEGRWVSLIRESVADVGGMISHVVERAGIEAARRRR
jgi:hypothetical protein